MRLIYRLFIIFFVTLALWAWGRTVTWRKPAAPDAAAFERFRSIEIIRDRFGVPHIFGKTDGDTAFGLAVAHSEDNWQTIYLSLMAARGRLSSVMLNTNSVKNDYYAGLINVSGRVQEQYDRFLSSAFKNVVESYAAGLNFYAGQHPDEVRGDFVPFTGRDIIAGFVHKLPLMLGVDKTLAELLDEPGVADRKTAGIFDSFQFFGSNAHAVHRSRSPDNVTRLNINSHQPWEGPVAWYEAHLRSGEGWSMSGATFPGAPMILHGHNDHLGWAHTVNRPDLVDTFVIERNPDVPTQYKLDAGWVDFEQREHEIVLDLGLFYWHHPLTFLGTAHGPVVETERGLYALRWAGLDRMVLAAEQWYRMNRASNFDEWQLAMRLQGIPMFNTVYADFDNIYYVHNALLPVRDPGTDWQGQVDGTKSSLIWAGYQDFDSLIQVHNPDSGFVQNCNSTPFGTTTGESLKDRDATATLHSIETNMTNRALRSVALLSTGDKIGREQFLNVKWDRVYDKNSKFWEKTVLPAQLVNSADPDVTALVTMLKGWDGRTSEDSEAASVAILAWYMQRKDVDMALTLKSVADFLRSHYKKLQVPLGTIQVIRRGDKEASLGGGPDLLNAVEAHLEDGKLIGYTGDSFVSIAEFSRESVQSFAVHQFGNSAKKESEHYTDQLDLYASRSLRRISRQRSELPERLPTVLIKPEDSR